MKKLIFILLLLVSAFGIWRYIALKSQPASSADRQSSVIKETKDTLQKTADYVPDAIDRKKAMENNINASINVENERLQKSLNEIQ